MAEPHYDGCIPTTQQESESNKASMDIGDWRKKIDELDGEIVRLISERARAAQAIGAIKQAAAMPVYEPGRETEVFAHVRAINPGPLPDEELQHVYERIIDVMRALQAKRTETGSGKVQENGEIRKLSGKKS